MPDGTRKRLLEVETTATGVRIHEEQRLIALHPLLHGRVSARCCQGTDRRRAGTLKRSPSGPTGVRAPGHNVARRALDIYEAVARRLGADSRMLTPAGAAR